MYLRLPVSFPACPRALHALRNGGGASTALSVFDGLSAHDCLSASMKPVTQLAARAGRQAVSSRVAAVSGSRLASSLTKGPPMDWTKQSWATLSHIPERVQIEGSDPNARVNADHSNVSCSPCLPDCARPLATDWAMTSRTTADPTDRVRVSAHVAQGQGRLLQADGRGRAEGLDHALDE